MEKVVLICAPVQGTELVYPGSVEDKCDNCGAKVWIAPSGQKITKKHKTSILCQKCGLDSMDESTVVKFSPEAAREIQAWQNRN